MNFKRGFLTLVVALLLPSLAMAGTTSLATFLTDFDYNDNNQWDDADVNISCTGGLPLNSGQNVMDGDEITCVLEFPVEGPESQMSEEESSVLISLKELMTIEEDRIKTEEEDKQEADAEAEQARLNAEQQAREAESARQHAEEERRRLEEQRRREDAARLEALKAAELETARSSAEQQARMEAMVAQ